MAEQEKTTRIRLVIVNNVVATVTPTEYGSSTLTVLGYIHIPFWVLPKQTLGQFDDISLQQFAEMFNGEIIELQSEYQMEYDGEFFGDTYTGRVLHNIQVTRSNDPDDTLTVLSFSWKDEDERLSASSEGEQLKPDRYTLHLSDFLEYLDFETIVPIQTAEVS